MPNEELLLGITLEALYMVNDPVLRVGRVEMMRSVARVPEEWAFLVSMWIRTYDQFGEGPIRGI